MIQLIIAICILLILYLLFFLENCRFTVNMTECRHEKVKTQFRVVQVSDLHDKAFGIQQCKLIEAIKSVNPDFIVITGDLFNRHNRSAYRNAMQFTQKAKELAPIYFAEGNHECALKEIGEQYISDVSECGVHILRDCYSDLAMCRLIGLKQYAPKETLEAMLCNDQFNLVLAHRPERFQIYADTCADVILSGHAHGGQIRLFGHGVYAPQQGVFPRYSEGWYQLGACRMFVSRGLGNTIAFPRVFNTPELNVIDFKPLKEKEN